MAPCICLISSSPFDYYIITHTHKEKKRKNKFVFFFFQKFLFPHFLPPPPQFLNVVQIVCPLWLLQLLSLLIISRRENYIEITLSHGSENMRQIQGNRVGLRFETKKKTWEERKRKSIILYLERVWLLLLLYIKTHTHTQKYINLVNSWTISDDQKKKKKKKKLKWSAIVSPMC